MKIFKNVKEIDDYIADNFNYFGEEDLNQLQEDHAGCGFVEYRKDGYLLGWVLEGDRDA